MKTFAATLSTLIDIFLSLLLQLISSQPFYTAPIDSVWKHGKVEQRYEGERRGECGWGTEVSSIVQSWSPSLSIVHPWVPGWMGIFFDKLLTSTYLLFVQTCWPWFAIHWNTESTITYSWADTGIHILRLQREKFVKVVRCLCHWVKLHLMALFRETRSMPLLLREHPSLPSQNTSSAAPSYVRFVTQKQTVPGHAAEHLSKIAQAVAGYYLWCLVTEPSCWFSLRAPACIFISRPFIRRR